MTLALFSRTRAFVTANGGVAAVEMALIAPVALAMLSLVVASGQSLNAWRRTNSVSHTVTDLVSRTPNTIEDPNISGAEDIAQSDLKNDLQLSQLVMYPSDPTTLQITLTEIQVNTTNNTGKVVWSQAYNGATPTPCNTVFTLNADITQAQAPYMLVGVATYTFQPLGVSLNLPPITLSSTEFLTVRYASQIVVTSVTDTTSLKQCP
jgi:Flp pilus assembly protein TadG